MKTKKRTIKTRSPFARALEQAQFRRRAVASKKAYSRKGRKNV